MKSRLLKILQDNNEYISGQELSKRLGVSRTAIWKAVNSLEADGYTIDAVRNKGYRLLTEPDILTRESCLCSLQTSWIGKNMVVFDKTDSTNTQARILGENNAEDGTVVAADSQESGKGRMGRVWKTPPGTAIAYSILLKPDISPQTASMLTLIAALSVSDAIEKVSGLKTQIKWPNDIVCNGKKMCGILTEMSCDMDSIHYVIVGIGINVHVSDFPEDIKDKATSILIESRKKVRRSELLARALEAFERYYEEFIRAGNMSTLKQEYEAKLANLDNKVCVLDPKGSWQGICRGIREDGALIVEKEDKTFEYVISGEVSVRGVYGYV